MLTFISCLQRFNQLMQIYQVTVSLSLGDALEADCEQDIWEMSNLHDNLHPEFCSEVRARVRNGMP